MKEFIEKWKDDKKYQTKVKLIVYTIFTLIVSIYAISLSKLDNTNNIDNQNDNIDTMTISLPIEYSYEITVIKNDIVCNYSGNKDSNQTTIIKKLDDITTNYIYRNNSYYALDIDTNNYIKTTRDEIYDIIDYNYLNIDNINNYLENAKKVGNQYLVYLKDIILDNDSEEYLIILINGMNVDIDYTPLMKKIDSSINNCRVNIKIKE